MNRFAELLNRLAYEPARNAKLRLITDYFRSTADPERGWALAAFASGWMRVRARARQQGVSLPLVISDHADWDGLTATIAATGAGEIWVTHGQEDALVHWCATRGLKARPLDVVGYGDEDEGGGSDDGGDA